MAYREARRNPQTRAGLGPRAEGSVRSEDVAAIQGSEGIERVGGRRQRSGIVLSWARRSKGSTARGPAMILLMALRARSRARCSAWSRSGAKGPHWSADLIVMFFSLGSRIVAGAVGGSGSVWVYATGTVAIGAALVLFVLMGAGRLWALW